MTATATITPPISIRPQIVLTLPRFFQRHKPETQGLVARVRRRFRLTAESIAAIFAKVTEKLWSHRPVRLAAYFLGAVATFMVANFTITFGSLLLAWPFWSLGWLGFGDAVFVVAYSVAWYLAIFYVVEWASGRW